MVVEVIAIRLDMRPTGKARPRERGRLPTAYRNWKKAAAVELAAHLQAAGWIYLDRDPHRAGVVVEITGYHRRPKAPPAWMDATERAAFRAGWTPPRLSTPDADNMAGAVLDALSDTGRAWHDDTQAILGRCYSTWAQAGEDPHILITLEPMKWPTP